MSGSIPLCDALLLRYVLVNKHIKLTCKHNNANNKSAETNNFNIEEEFTLR